MSSLASRALQASAPTLSRKKLFTRPVSKKLVPPSINITTLVRLTFRGVTDKSGFTVCGANGRGADNGAAVGAGDVIAQHDIGAGAAAKSHVVLHIRGVTDHDLAALGGQTREGPDKNIMPNFDIARQSDRWVDVECLSYRWGRRGGRKR